MLFRISNFVIKHSDIHFYPILENYLLDIYHTNRLIREGDIVIDIGAGVGDFAIKAASKTGRRGKVVAIEPNADDYQLMLENIQLNNCHETIIPLNIGVAEKQGIEKITFAGRTYSFNVEPLRVILQKQGINRIDLIKMDIEGYETEVLRQSTDILKDVSAIAIELHGTKKEVDNILEPLGFKFNPIKKSYIYVQILKSLLFRPGLTFSIFREVKKQNPKIISKMAAGLDIVSNHDNLIVGVYLRNGKRVSNTRTG